MGETKFTTVRSGARVVFGAGSVSDLEAEIDKLGAKRVLLVCSPRRGAEVSVLSERLGARVVGTLPIAAEHVPIEQVKTALEETDRTRADALLVLGGGSALGLGKAVAAERDVKLVAIPTTYAGSEMTDIYGVTDGGNKRTARVARVRPVLVLYDPTLTTALPLKVSLESLWNAAAHCVEALWWPEADPIAWLTAEHGLQVITAAMPALVADPGSPKAREQALLGGYLAGVALSETGTGLQHKLAHLLGGSFDLPHAATHAVLLPHVVRYNAQAAPEAARVMAKLLGVGDASEGLLALARRVGTQTRLDALGFSPARIDVAVDALLAMEMKNPRKLERAALRALLAAACGN
jgi:alcohol dehydrogenase class IV